MLKDIFLKFKSCDTEVKCYMLGTLLFGIYFILSFKFADFRPIFATLSILISFCFFLGFLLWSYATIKTMWDKRIGKTIIVATTPIIYLLIETISKNIIAEIFGLPPQDFPLTIGFLNYILFVPTICMLCSVLMSIAILIISISYIIVYIARNLINQTLNIFAPSKKIKELMNFKRGSRIFGAIFTSIFLAFIWGNSIISINKATNAIKFIAFYSDYQNITNYPNIAKDERVILHENSVISSAKIINNEVIINIRKPSNK